MPGTDNPCTPFNVSRSLSLDRLIDTEKLALRIFGELEAAEVRAGERHPLLHEAAHALWRAYSGIARQRQAVEAEWMVPQ